MRVAFHILGAVTGFVLFLTSAVAAHSEQRRLAVISAFEPEWTALSNALENAQDAPLGGIRVKTGVLEGHPVALALTGVSIVNAAMATQAVIDAHDPAVIIVSGIAGGVDPSLNIGDVLVADQWGQYLETVAARETEGGFVLPPFFEYPTQAHYGIWHPRLVDVHRAGGVSEKTFWFPADGHLLSIAKRVVEQGVQLAQCTAGGDCLTKAPRLVIGGNGVSGPSFVDNADFRDWTFETFQARVLDMESAAIAHVAYAHEVPVIVFRSLSDLAGGGEGANEMGIFFQLAANNAATVVQAFLKSLPPVE